MFERFFQIAHSCNFVTQVFVPKLSTFPIIRLQDRIQSKLVQQEHQLKIKLVSGKQLHATTSGGSLKFLPECEYNTYGCFSTRECTYNAIKTSWILTVPIAQSDHDKFSVEGNLSTQRG